MYFLKMSTTQIRMKVFAEFELKEIGEIIGSNYKGQELEITYKSPVDLQIQIIKDYQFNPMTLAIVRNNLDAIKFFV